MERVVNKVGAPQRELAGARCIIVGAGGHGAVIADALRMAHPQLTLVAVDADDAKTSTELLDVPVIGNDSVLPALLADGFTEFVIGVGGTGDNDLRQRLFEHCLALGLAPMTVSHPTAIVSGWAVIHQGAQLLPACVVNARTTVGANAIVNSGAIVEHDCMIGAHVHVSPGAKLASGIKVGEGAHVGIGASVREGVSIGTRAVVGAGAAVVSDVEQRTVVTGVPARVMVRGSGSAPI